MRNNTLLSARSIRCLAQSYGAHMYVMEVYLSYMLYLVIEATKALTSIEL
jgi:hypothetical protein